MPRIAEQDSLDPAFDWDTWWLELSNSPTGALFFSSDDFGAMAPYRFRRHAQKAWGHLNVTVSVRGDEVLVVANAS